MSKTKARGSMPKSGNARKKRSLSKSQYVRGLQCHKGLWLYRNRKDLLSEVAAAQQMIFDQGQSVGVLAHQRFPGGVLITEDHTQAAEAIASTQAAVKAGARTLYEAGVIHADVLVRADIIVRTKDNKAWDLIEVKSSTAVKEVYLNDVAVQRYVLEGAGFRIRKTFLMHINNEYVRKGAIDPRGLFTLADITQEALALQKIVPTQLKAMKVMLAKSAAPVMAIGAQCFDPYACDFEDHCWAKVPDYSVFDLGGARFEKKIGWWRKGIKSVADIPDDGLSRAQSTQVRVARSRRPHIDLEGITEALDELAYPLYFLDFETINLALPPYNGLRPFQQLPFQASVHVLARKGGALKHEEFLDDGRQDPRLALVAFLTRVIGPKGTVIAYNKGFEGNCLKELAQSYPRHAKKLLSMKERLWDLAGPFRSVDYVHPKFHGSWSIKNVLPVLIPSMTYEGMPIHDGGGAQVAYINLMSGKLSAMETRRTMKDLKAYCGQDTLAMVELLGYMNKLLDGGPDTRHKKLS